MSCLVLMAAARMPGVPFMHGSAPVFQHACMLHVQNDDPCITHTLYTQSRHAFLHLTFQKILQSRLPRSEEEMAETSTWRPLLAECT